MLNPKEISEKLLPCPFCGVDNAYDGYDEDSSGFLYYVVCYNCHACVEEFTTKEAAIKAWNTRKTEEKQ